MNLKTMDIARLENFLTEKSQPKFRIGQIEKAVFQDGLVSFSEMTNLPKNLREVLNKEFPVLSFSVEKVLVSRDKKSAKALFKLQDGNLLESVLISPLENTWSVCVSSQVGCALGCRFCATGKMGFKRNLSSEEITDQVLFWKGWVRGSADIQNPLCPDDYIGTSPPDYRGRGQLSVLKGAALVREVHTYGKLTSINKKNKKSPQHIGLGKKLLKEAERIAREEFGMKKIAVISGVGVRGYYRKNGYRLSGTYMVKKI